MDAISVKVVLVAWMINIHDGKLFYFMPIMVMQDQSTCEKAFSDLKETHQRGYAFNLVLRGTCVSAISGG